MASTILEAMGLTPVAFFVRVPGDLKTRCERVKAGLG
jgi:hypothetical protein